jgi:hypothetical protein
MNEPNDQNPPTPQGDTIEQRLGSALLIIASLWRKLKEKPAPAQNGSSSPAGVVDQAAFEEKMLKAKTPQERAQIATEFEKTVKAQ